MMVYLAALIFLIAGCLIIGMFLLIDYLERRKK